MSKKNEVGEHFNFSKRIKVKKIISIFIIIFSATFLQGQNLPELYKKCLPSIVKISVLTYDGTALEGTGFFIGEQTIVTCYHVADNVNAIEIETSDGKKYTVDSIIACNQKTDLIKFTVKEKSKLWLKLSDKLPDVGENVFIIGNPDDYDFSVSNGIVSAVRMKNNVQVIQNTAPCSPGSSGSPVFNSQGNVIGVMSYVKFAGQNLNFAATSINVINMEDDKSIKHLSAVCATLTGYEMDSIVKLANKYFSAKDYKSALNAILPVTKFANGTQGLEFTELIGNCHFFLQDYAKAGKYYEHLIKGLYDKKQNAQDAWTYAQTLEKLSICDFILGDKDGALEMLAKSADVCKAGIEADASRKQVYILLIQQIYTSDANCKYSMNKTSEACLSWKIAKQYGYSKDDYGFDGICK